MDSCSSTVLDQADDAAGMDNRWSFVISPMGVVGAEPLHVPSEMDFAHGLRPRRHEGL
jgi:hypothetical protein